MLRQITQEALETTCLFWRLHPGLLHGLAFLLGCLASYGQWHMLLLPALLLWLPLLFFKQLAQKERLRFFTALLFCASACGYSSLWQQLPTREQPGFDRASGLDTASEQASTPLPPLVLAGGKGHFSIDKIQQTAMYGKQWLYTGKVDYFSATGERLGRRVPCRIRISDKLKRPDASCSYVFPATLRESQRGYFTLIPSTTAPWQKKVGSFSFAEMRYRAQQKVADYIRREIKHRQSANFLVGIATGDFQDRQLNLQFSRFGLQHIMAISGFHFSILASILALLLSLLLPKSTTSYLLILFLSAYFIFLGPAPAVMRAWISCMIGLSATLTKRKGAGLNSLGIALFTILIIDPSFALAPGFQFSFAATAAILMLYPLCEILLQLVFPKRALTEAVQMDFLNKWGYIALSFFRQSIALGLAVNMVALPLTLLYFNTFPWLSLPYNLFFPCMIAISLFLLVIGGILWMIIPPAGHLINGFNSYYTHQVLQYTTNLPLALDRSLSIEEFPSLIPAILFPMLFAVGLWHTVYQKQQKGQNEDWAFL